MAMCPRDLIPLAIVMVFGIGSDGAAQARQTSADVLRPVDAQMQESQRAEIGPREPHIVLEAPEGGVESLRITDPEGTEITDELRLRQDATGRIRVAVPDRGAIVVKDRRIETLRATSDERLVLPNGLFLMERGGDPGAGENEAVPGERPREAEGTWLRLTLKPSPIPAPWSSEEDSYVTELSFGVHPTDGATDRSINLEHPVEVRVSLEGLITKQALPPMRIEAAGLAHEQTVPLRFVPTTPNPTLQVRSTISDVDVVLVALPRLEVRPESTSMMGLGLERIDVSLQRVTPHGAPLRPERPADVAITLTGGGRIEPGSHRINPGESQVTFGLRSSGWGRLSVAVAAGGLRGAAVIDQRIPWVPLGVALAGGAIGGYARRFVKDARQKLTGRRLAEGIVVAVIAYVAAVLGVGYFGLPAVVATTEAGAFLTGALAGFVGVNVLEGLSKARRVSAN